MKYEDDNGNYAGPVEIYMLTAPNGKKYVGQTQSYVRDGGNKGWRPYGFERRWARHQGSAAKPNKRSNACVALHNSIRKYGGGNFKTETLVVINKHLANEYETKFILAYDTVAPHGLNLSTGGEVRYPSAESRERMSVAKLGKRKSDATRALMSVAARARVKPSGLPLYVTYCPANLLQSDGYSVQVWFDGRAHTRKFIKQSQTLEEKLASAIKARDAIMTSLGMPPV